jgi:hypothetical protein
MMEVLFETMTLREGGQPPPMKTLKVMIFYCRSDYVQRRILMLLKMIQIMLNQPVLIYWAMQQPTMMSLLVTPPPR